MKKIALARMTIIGMQQEQMLDIALENLSSVVAESMSAIATIDPETALSMIEQLNKQAPGIRAQLEARDKDTDKKVKTLTKGLPDSLELEAGEPDEDDEDSATH